ncbi:hypothetical protein QFZ30_002690 [Arthrobacter pascens]|uniref:hypothetical protein n=1 Tax=Arthrobacter pascens TaxID=1677 RepID=UPI00278E5ACD|nr:hypothetical protein [Arthrobacter pascens]MDQ0679308.1 hypothetical protein [Arthrobacter pascens]
MTSADVGRRGGTGMGVAVAGMLLIAATYGMARFGVGLFAPLFGAGYMGLSAVLILWARHAWPGNGGAGTSILFIALASGQAMGSVGFGAAQGFLGPIVLASLAASLCATGGLVPLMGKR